MPTACTTGAKMGVKMITCDMEFMMHPMKVRKTQISSQMT